MRIIVLIERRTFPTLLSSHVIEVFCVSSRRRSGGRVGGRESRGGTQIVDDVSALAGKSTRCIRIRSFEKVEKPERAQRIFPLKESRAKKEL